MNSGITISCKDKIFSRMLEIELKNAGCTVMPKNTSEDYHIVHIRDIDGKKIEITSSTDSDKRIFTRPFYVRDVVSYVSTLIKVDEIQETNQPYTEVIEKEAYYELVIDDNTRNVTFKGETVSLTKREYDLLLYLYINRGKAISRDEAVAKVWKYDFTGDTNIVDVYIRYLREKLDDRFNTKLIYTVRNKGYMIK